jgi:uncharacterized membrane protein YeaQ/YmgE (transglycosylase-associated protein family)
MWLLLWADTWTHPGFIASKIAGGTGQGAVMDIVLGVVGAVVSGWLFSTFGRASVGGFELYSLLVAVVCASTLLLVYHAGLRGVRGALFNLDLEN